MEISRINVDVGRLDADPCSDPVSLRFRAWTARAEQAGTFEEAVQIAMAEGGLSERDARAAVQALERQKSAATLAEAVRAIEELAWIVSGGLNVTRTGDPG